MTLLIGLIAFFTALLSGVFGMGGGMLLMGVLLAVMPLSGAMVVHGSVQLVSNGARAWLLRRHIRWSILPGYLLGAVLSAAVFAALALRVDAAVALLVLGATPLLLSLLPRLRLPSVLRFRGALACGALVAACQLLVGVSGALLDLLFVSAAEQEPRFDRHAVVATKAVTQTLGHATKIVYFGALFGAEGVAPPLVGLALVATVAGTRVGTLLLSRLEDDRFRRYSRALILAIGCVFVARGVMQW